MKPIEYNHFLEKIKTNLHIEWVYEGLLGEFSPQKITPPIIIIRPPSSYIQDLRKLGQIGHVRGIQLKLSEFENELPEYAAFFTNLRGFVNDFNLSSYMTALEDNHE